MNWKVLVVLVAVVIVGAVAFLVLAGPSKPGGNGGSASAERVVVFARSEDSKTLDTQDTSSGEDVVVTTCLFETLVRFKDGGSEIGEGLATSWKPLDGGRVWEFDLRENVFFHDGSLFTADDVVFSFHRLIKDRKDFPHAPKKRPYASLYKDIESVEKLEQHKVRVTLKVPGAVFLKNIAMFPAGIVSSAAVKKHGDDFGNNPVGTGCMQLVEWKKGDKIVLKRYERYWARDLADRQAKSDRLIFIHAKNARERIEKLRSGEAHIATNLALADVESIKVEGDLKLEFAVSMNVCYLGFNMNTPPYNNVDLRRAIGYGINRKKLINKAYFGHADAANSICPPSIFVPNVTEPKYTYDPEKAKAFLAKSGVADQEFVIWEPVISRPYMPNPQDVAVSLKDDMELLGLKVRIEKHQWNAYLDKLDDADSDHPMFLLGWSTDNGDPDNFYYALLHGDSIGGTNSSFFNNAEFNSLVKQAQSEVDETKRTELYTKAEKVYRDQLPSIPLVHVRQAVAFRKDVSYKLHPIEARAYQVEIVGSR